MNLQKFRIKTEPKIQGLILLKEPNQEEIIPPPLETKTEDNLNYFIMTKTRFNTPCFYL